MRSLPKFKHVTYPRWRHSPHPHWSLPPSIRSYPNRHLSSRKTLAAESSKPRWPGFIFVILLISGGGGLAISYSNSQAPELNPQTFSPFTLESKEAVSSTSSIFTLTPSGVPSSVDQYQNIWKQGIWSVQIKQPQLQIARAYTPLPPIEGECDNSNNLRSLIRHDAHGEVSSYLHKLPLHASIDLRGPHLEYKVPEDVDEILFLAGGTGIAPALQTAYTLFQSRGYQDEKTLPEMHILWANRTKEDCAGAIYQEASGSNGLLNQLFRRIHTQNPTPKPVENNNLKPSSLVHQLSALQKSHHPNLHISYFIDSDHKFITPAVLKHHLHTPQKSPEQLQSQRQRKKLILISGPEGFVTYLAGPKKWRGGSEQQGPLGGILGTMGIEMEGWDVWKL